MAAQFSDEEIEEIRKIFDEADKDGDGHLTHEELLEALKEDEEVHDQLVEQMVNLVFFNYNFVFSNFS
jgi:Ca2+-binding EF-hand superfamily protein